MKDLKKIVGRKIAKERKKQALTQEKLAEQTNFHRTFIGKIERGECNITIDTLQKICSVLKVSPAKLFENLEVK